MLEKCRLLPLSDAEYLEEYFSCPLSLLSSRGLCEADVVLALLWADRLRAAELVAGCSIKRLPPDPRLDPRPMPPPPRRTGRDDRRVVFVARNPRLPTTGAFQRYRKIRPGLTVLQLLSRGVTRRDIRRSVRSGHVRLR